MINEFKEFFKPIEILRQSKVKNSHGDWVLEYSHFGNGQGYVATRTGSSQFIARKTTHISTHRLYTGISYIKEGDKIVYEGRTFTVVLSNPMVYGVAQVDLQVVE